MAPSSTAELAQLLHEVVSENNSTFSNQPGEASGANASSSSSSNRRSRRRSRRQRGNQGVPYQPGRWVPDTNNDLTFTHPNMPTATEVAASPAQGVAISVQASSIEPQIDGNQIDGNQIDGNQIDGKAVEVKNDPHLEVEKLKSKLALAEKAAEIHAVSGVLEEKLVRIKELEVEFNDEVQALNVKLEGLKTEYQGLESKLRSTEGMKQNFVLAVRIDSGDADKVHLRKAELEIIKMKSTMMEKEIAIMELDMEIKEKTAKSTKNDELSAARAELEELQQKLSALIKDLDEATAEYSQNYGVFACGNDDGGSQDTLACQVEALKMKVEQLMPLYWVGFATRARYIEYEMKYLRGTTVNPGVEGESHLAWKLGKPQADATLFLDFAEKQRLDSTEFEILYGMTPSVAWQHRGFTILMNIAGWKYDMRRMSFIYKSDAFNGNFHKLFDRIIPSFELKCDEDICKDDELMAAYLILQSEHEKAVTAFTQRGPPAQQNGGSSSTRRNFSRS